MRLEHRKVSADAIATLVKRLDALTRRYLVTEGNDPDDRKVYQLYPPASAKAIAGYEKTLGRELPPSYRHFLRQHNGWLGFWGDHMLLGVPAPYNARRHAYVRRELRASNGYLDDGDEGPDYFRSEEVIPIACDLNGGLVAFDMSRVDGRGEPQVIDCQRTNGCVDNRHASFVELLEVRIRCARGWIAGAR